ncbi:hypothetical protein BASA83_011700 [Batrachochytrium salamandrivorans]|nr:hypothetical protein BASA83_011700 [Batrachochytrium salamandrivorans]
MRLKQHSQSSSSPLLLLPLPLLPPLQPKGLRTISSFASVRRQSSKPIVMYPLTSLEGIAQSLVLTNIRSSKTTINRAINNNRTTINRTINNNRTIINRTINNNRTAINTVEQRHLNHRETLSIQHIKPPVTVHNLMDAIDTSQFRLAYTLYTQLVAMASTTKALTQLPAAYYGRLIFAVQRNLHGILSSSSRTKGHRCSIEILDRMVASNVTPTASIHEMMLYTYAMQGDIAKMESTLTFLKSQNYSTTTSNTVSLVITGYIVGGLEALALEHFDNWRTTDKSIQPQLPFHTLLKAYSYIGDEKKFLHTLDYMRYGNETFPGTSMTHITYTIVATHYLKIRDLDTAEKWLSVYKSTRFALMDVVLFTIEVTIANLRGDHTQALAILRKMRDMHVPFRASTYAEEVIALAGSVSASDATASAVSESDNVQKKVWRSVMELKKHRYPEKRVLAAFAKMVGPVTTEADLIRVSNSIDTYQISFESTMMLLINGFAALGDAKSVKMLIGRLEWVQESRFHPNLYQQVLHAYLNSCEFNELIKFAFEMRKIPIKIHESTWNAIFAKARETPMVLDCITRYFTQWYPNTPVPSLNSHDQHGNDDQCDSEDQCDQDSQSSDNDQNYQNDTTDDSDLLDVLLDGKDPPDLDES